MMNAAPRAMPITPSVAMNAGSRTTTTSSAFRTPAASPTASATPALAASGQPRATNRSPATTPVSAMTAPGERSMPPAMITTAAPMAAMP